LIEEDPHVVSGFAHRAVVLVENLTVAEHQVHVLTKLVPQLVHAVVELLSDGRDVHRCLDDLLVSWELFGVDGLQEGPGFVVTSQF